jgi:hypothetical protein
MVVRKQVNSIELLSYKLTIIDFVLRDGSFYHANAYGSTYWNNGKGKSRTMLGSRAHAHE